MLQASLQVTGAKHRAHPYGSLTQKSRTRGTRGLASGKRSRSFDEGNEVSSGFYFFRVLMAMHALGRKRGCIKPPSRLIRKANGTITPLQVMCDVIASLNHLCPEALCTRWRFVSAGNEVSPPGTPAERHSALGSRGQSANTCITRLEVRCDVIASPNHPCFFALNATLIQWQPQAIGPHHRSSLM